MRMPPFDREKVRHVRNPSRNHTSHSSDFSMSQNGETCHEGITRGVACEAEFLSVPRCWDDVQQKFSAFVYWAWLEGQEGVLGYKLGLDVNVWVLAWVGSRALSRCGVMWST